MSEKTHHQSHEYEQNNREVEDATKELLDKMAEKGHEAAAEHAEKVKETLEDIKAEAKEKAQKAEDLITKREQETKEPDAPLLINKDLKNIKYKRTLQSVQKDLKPTERVLSRVVHNETVDAVSEVAGKTIARPSGFLAGAIFAFIGSSAFLWISRHYGYEYNFLFFVMFFVAGFVFGLGVELLVRLLHRKKA